MKKPVLFSILAFILCVSAKAQDVKEVDLVKLSHLDGIIESTTILKDAFTAIKKAAVNDHIGTVKSIILSSRFTNRYFVMTLEKKFYCVDYNDRTKTAEIAIGYVMTKENVDGISMVDMGFIKYIIRNPECRIPDDIPNSKNTLTSEE